MAGGMSGWPGTLPCHGPRRAATLEGLQATIATDCWKTVAAMVADGWDSVDAFRAYEAWLTDLMAWALVDAVRSWREGMAA